MTGETHTATGIGLLEARLLRLEDVEAIRRLFLEYRRLLDRRDFAAYAKLFTEDGEWLGNLGCAKGPAEIEQLLIRTLDGWTGESSAHLHLVDNVVIDVDGDRAEATSTWVYITRDFSDNPVLSLIGHYEDVLARTDAGWRFLRRVAYLDFPYEALELSP
jgi:ketosteroid isomerase-like protein